MPSSLIIKTVFRSILTIGLVCLSLTSRAQSTSIFTHEPLSSTRPMFNNHVANLSSIGGDSLICFWFGGVNEGTTDNRIAYSISTDKGTTWAPKTVLLDHPGSDTLYRDAVLWQNDGKFYLFFIVQEGAGGGSSAQSLDFAYISSNDRGSTWSALKYIIPSGYNDSIRIITPFNKPIFIGGLPAFGVHWRIDGSSQPHAGLMVCDFAQDTFQLRGDIVEQHLYVEPAVLDNNDSIIMYFRASRGAVEYSVSKDDGFNWTTPQRTQLPNPYALVTLNRHNADTLLLAWNNSSFGRNYLSVGLFKGFKFEQLIWKTTIDIKPSKFGQVSYPSLVRKEDSVYVAYSYRKDIGLDTNGRPVVFGDILFNKLELFNEVKQKSGALTKDFGLNTFVNEYLFLDSLTLMAGDDSFGGIHFENSNSMLTAPILNTPTPYRMRTVVYDSVDNSVTFAGDGGWLIQYNLSTNQTSEEKRFANWGKTRINDLMIIDSTYYMIGNKGELSTFNEVSDRDMTLLQDLDIDLRSFTLLRDTIFIAADSQAVFAYSLANANLSEYLSPNSNFAFNHIGQWGDTLVLLGEKGSIKLLYGSNSLDLSLDSVSSTYDYHSFTVLNDSLILLGSDQDLFIVYNVLNQDQITHYLPENALLNEVKVDDSLNVHLYSRQGKQYVLPFNQLFLSINRENRMQIGNAFLQLFPNPTYGKSIIKSDIRIQTLEISNIQGKILKRFESLNTNYMELNFSNLPKGILIINAVHSSGDRSSLKVLNSSN